jgi:hypothetical protein
MLATTLLAFAASAAEQPLAFTVTGPTVESGAHQVLLSTTPRFGRPEEFVRFENLVGFAYGLSPALEAQLLLAVAIESVGVESHGAEGAIATRWRWQPLDARVDPIGLSLLGTVAGGPESLFLEARATTESWLGDFLFALNASADFAVRRSGAGANAHLEQSGGALYRLANNFTSGFEIRNRIGFDHGTWLGDAIFAGPVFSWRAKSWWLSFAGLAQVAAVKADEVRGNGEPLELRDNERFVLRLQLGFDVR